jgi:periplasmic divalent cation tolerance protein
MPQTEFVFVYSTVPSKAAADRIAEALVTLRLAACVNIHGPMSSFTEWHGKLESGEEYALFIKTRRDIAGQAIAVARPLHPYSLPAFLVLPVDAGNDDYIDWVHAQTVS